MFRRYRIRKDDLCISCLRCAKECSFGAITVGKDNALVFHHEKCTDCQRCVSLCPRGAIYITEYENRYRGNSVFKGDDINEILIQADTGGVLLSSMGASGENVPIYFDTLDRPIEGAYGDICVHRSKARVCGEDKGRADHG